MAIQEENKEELLKRFGQHLRSLREAKGISSAEMARRCYMDRGNYTRLESGQKDVQISTLQKISRSLDTTIEDLFKGFR